MKLLMRAAALAVAMHLHAAPLQSQGYTTLGFDVRLSTPAGELGDWHQLGLGAALLAEYDLSMNWRAVGQLGYTHFAGKAIRGIPDAAPDLRVLGASAGVQAFISATPLHVGMEFGYYSYRSGREHFSNAGLTHDFGFLPTIGYRTGTFDVSAQYKVGGDAQWLQVRAGLQVLRF